ncbi:MAG: 16S rRNA (cytidine(1402)-2'-O)-methyltransferase [Bacillota bacterium]|uniref:16S rRNA (cytidine(1402)-2'-O)-methyltransferase n=1 Tax=Bacillus sp. RO2 TaxID=2723913 RepID=UPI00145D6F63|nr:16S rRNA (cytidine(1402)-2'-O)-methyltransferase [Bacillus sp. RO2]MEA3319997.1 16S rRNA (cytidine(1402)-2'-O)-methyltransferase [Bacillota bacterium]NMH74491.1 16S rRNA (cytidine(1402)-2'-O)-methyltransferase [Bacillus sp. RO2]
MELWQQNSFSESYTQGRLYLIPTPIGNLEDITYRSLRMLKEVDYIAAEDTRNTKKLCNYFEITTPLISYHEHNKEQSGRKIIDLLKDGKNIGLVSDAGMPSISDPGYEIVVEALEEKLYVVPLPGANAALTALIASGLVSQPFYFYGFLDRQKKEKKKELERLKKFTDTFILYESPHRLKETLSVMHEILGNRSIVVSRELTKKFEEFTRGSISEVLALYEEQGIKGECCIIIEGSSEEVQDDTESWWQNLSILEHVQQVIETEGYSSKEAIKQVSKERNLPKREVYQAYHVE